MGLADNCFGTSTAAFHAETEERIFALADRPGFEREIAQKHRQRSADEAVKPLERYRNEELERMKLNFFGFDSSYHVARYNFVFKVPRSRTPSFLATHRTIRPRSPVAT